MESQKNAKAFLLFGAFNPVSIAHVAMGKYLHDIYPDATIVYIPSSDAYLSSEWKRQNKYIPFKIRYDLLKASVDEEYCVISDIEDGGDAMRSIKTFDTVEVLKKEYDDITICLGEDKLSSLALWYKADELIRNNNFVIFSRFFIKGFDNNDKLPPELSEYADHFQLISWSGYTDVSSTSIRSAWQAGCLDAADYMMTKPVYEYLLTHRPETILVERK